MSGDEVERTIEAYQTLFRAWVRLWRISYLTYEAAVFGDP